MQRSRPSPASWPAPAARLRLGPAADALAQAEAGRFILFLPAFQAAGIVAYFGWPGEPAAAPAVLLAAASLAAASLAAILAASSLAAGASMARESLATHWVLRSRMVSAALLCAGLAATGFACAQNQAARAPPFPDLPRHAAIVTGQVTALERLPEGRRVTLAAASLDGGQPLSRTLRIRLRDSDAAPVAPGDLLQLRALLRPPSPPAYPGGWDTQRDAFFAGLGGYGFALGATTRLHAAPDAPLPRIRAAIQTRILAVLPGPRGAIAATLLTGLGAAIPAEDRGAFQDSGLAHLLAVAGLHIGIVMALAYTAMRRGLALSERAALYWPLKQIAAIAALGAGAAYLVLTGAHVPILRSFAMACLVTLALVTGRRAVSLRGLALAAVILMLASPNLVVGVSFQMSFAAVLALVAGWEALSPHLVRLHGPGRGRFVARHALAGLVTSLLAGTASLPVAAYHFGNATLYYVPANLVAVPLTALWVMPWGLAALVLMPLGLHGLALAPMGWGIGCLLWIAHAVAAWPDARVALPQLPPAALALFLLGLVWLCLWRSRLRLAGISAMAAGLAIAVTTPPPDILVGDGARLIAVSLAGQAFVSARPGVSRFDREAPSRLWGIVNQADFPRNGAAAGGAMTCDATQCRIALHGGTAILLRQPGASCPQAAVVMSQAWANCASMPVIDRDRATTQGAATIWLTATGALIRTVAADRGARPWTRALPLGLVRLPPALTE